MVEDPRSGRSKDVSGIGGGFDKGRNPRVVSGDGAGVANSSGGGVDEDGGVVIDAGLVGSAAKDHGGAGEVEAAGAGDGEIGAIVRDKPDDPGAGLLAKSERGEGEGGDEGCASFVE